MCPTETAASASVDLYREVHKGLRLVLFELAGHAGAIDASNRESVDEFAEVFADVDMNAGNATGSPWELDLYSPTDGADLPVVVLLHGFGVGRLYYSDWSEEIAANGSVVYTIGAPVGSTAGMGLHNGAGFRAISEALGCAVGYARETAAELGGDPDRVILVAHSWGTLYAAWFALGADSLQTGWEQYATAHGGPPEQTECEVDPSATVEGFVGVGGGRYGDVEQMQFEDGADLEAFVSPYSYLGENLGLPIRLLFGRDDDFVDRESTPEFHAALLDAGHDVELVEFDGRHIVPPTETYEAVVEMAGT